MNVKFHFEDLGQTPYGHIWRPVAKVSLQSTNSNKWVIIWMIVDTGADYTILPRHFSEKLRISLEKECIKDITFGVGGGQTIYFYKSKVTVKIGNLTRNIPLGFFDNNESAKTHFEKGIG